MFVQIYRTNIYKIMPKSIENKKGVTEKREIISGNEHFKGIIGAIKKHLPADWRQRVFAKFPDLETIEGNTMLDNIYYQRSAADVDVILFMHDMAEANKNNPSIH